MDKFYDMNEQWIEKKKWLESKVFKFKKQNENRA